MPIRKEAVMNQGELKTLEEKTRKIVETLEALDS